MKFAIIGYGNPLRADDAVGWCVAQQLADFAERPGVYLLATHSLTPELSAVISEADLAIFIDAECGHNPGLIQRQTVTVEPHAKRSLLHAMTPGQLLSLAKALYGQAPPAVLFTVTGASFEHRESLTPLVRRSCDKVVEQIKSILQSKRIDEAVHSGPTEAYGYA